MNRTDAIVAACFVALGLYLLISGAALPAGIGRLLGAGFFPVLIGLATSGLALCLLASAFRRSGLRYEIENHRALGGVIGLTFVYLFLWGSGLFVVRTAVFLALFLRMLGERWKTSLAVAAVLTAGVTLAFQYGLRVSLE